MIAFPGRVTAPFSRDQVIAVNAFQADDRFTPYLCQDGTCHSAIPLLATPSALTCVTCLWKQEWVHETVISMGKNPMAADLVNEVNGWVP